MLVVDHVFGVLIIETLRLLREGVDGSIIPPLFEISLRSENNVM